MVSHAPDVDLATRLGRIMDILDVIVPEAEEHYSAGQHSSALALEHIARNDIAQAVSLLGNTLRKNPLWLRGYLLLATIYEEMRDTKKAIMLLENGINVCRGSLRSLAMQSCSLSMSEMFSRGIRSRILHRAAHVSRSEQMLRHRLTLVLVQAGHFEEALQCWTELEDRRCA